MSKRTKNQKRSVVFLKKSPKIMENTKVWQIVSAVLLIALIISITRNVEEGGGANETIPTVAANLDSNGRVSLSGLSEEVVKGDPNAPITIIEFSDYECPFCQRFYTNTLGQIDAKYIETGKVKMVFKDFPLGFHSQAQKASEAAECAGDQDRYWDMHDILFESGVTGGVNSFKKYASDLGLDTDAFNTCLDNGKYFAEVQADLKEGAAAGVTGTPAFLVNGKLIVGAQPFSVFEQAIEAELAKLN